MRRSSIAWRETLQSGCFGIHDCGLPTADLCKLLAIAAALGPWPTHQMHPSPLQDHQNWCTPVLTDLLTCQRIGSLWTQIRAQKSCLDSLLCDKGLQMKETHVRICSLKCVKTIECCHQRWATHHCVPLQTVYENTYITTPEGHGQVCFLMHAESRHGRQSGLCACMRRASFVELVSED